MIFTLYYMYATILQWWRLGLLKNKLNGTLNSHNALLVCNQGNFVDKKRKRCLENLLVQKNDRLACTVVPKQVVDLSQWAAMARDSKCFPIFINDRKLMSKSTKIYLMVQTCFEKYIPHESEIIEIENYGEPVAWRVEENFELILKTDLENLTKFAFSFCDHSIDINHELQLLKLETVDVVGNPVKIKYDRNYTFDDLLKYSLAPARWKKFVDDIRNIYSKVKNVEQSRFLEHPRITIETTNKCEETKKVPISEVKPIKKEHHRKLHTSRSEKEKNKLDVNSGTIKRTKEHKKRQETDKEVIKSSKRNEEAKTTTVSSAHAHKHKREQNKTDTKSKEDRKTEVKTNAKEKSPKTGVKLKSKNSEERKLKREPSFEECEIKDNSAKATPVNLNLKLTKPLNVLVFADSTTTKNNVKTVLQSILNNNKYTMYDFPTNCNDHFVWSESTGLLVVCGSVPNYLTSQMLHFLLNGGQMLCMCSDLLYSVLHCFSTAEVREHELVTFSYGNWKQVQMMHHVFCYQASPTKKQFSKDSDQSSHSNGSRGSSPVAPRTPSTVEVQHNGKKYLLQIQVLGTEETWQTPSLLLASVKSTYGRAIFSQVHLEIDPTEFEDDERKYTALKGSNNARVEILKHILTSHLEMDCDNSFKNFEYKPGYFLGRHNAKQQFLNDCTFVKNNVLETEKLVIKFCGKDEEIGECSPNRLPIYLLACPSNFSTVEYFETLKTDEIGRLTIYMDIITSSHVILTKKLVHGLIVIPRKQTQGIGRSKNTWLSPDGCAMFSLQLHIPLDSSLGRYLSLIQHLVSVSIISAIRSLRGYEELDLGLKWPNDIYFNKDVKIGGVVVNTSIMSQLAVVNVGVGFNLNNSEPTTCLNDIIKNYNQVNGKELAPIEYEKYFAYVFNELEKNIKIVQTGNSDYFYDLYYKYWLHSGTEVSVKNENDEIIKATVIGIDDYGFLKVKSEFGKVFNVQPDGNSFNMLTGLIAPKNY